MAYIKTGGYSHGHDRKLQEWVDSLEKSDYKCKLCGEIIKTMNCHPIVVNDLLRVHLEEKHPELYIRHFDSEGNPIEVLVKVEE